MKFEIDKYIELYDPFKNRYLPVRILEQNTDGYKVKLIPNGKEINIYNYQIKTYGYRELWISRELLEYLGTEKNGLKTQIDSTIVWECLIGELKNSERNQYIYEFSSKFLGYAIISDDSLKEFMQDFKKIDFNSDNKEFKSKYLISSSANELFNQLKKNKSEKYNFDELDKIVRNYREL